MGGTNVEDADANMEDEEDQDNPPDDAPRNFRAADSAKTSEAPAEKPVEKAPLEPPVQAEFVPLNLEPEPTVLQPPKVDPKSSLPKDSLTQEWHAATRAIDDTGRHTAVRQPVNVPGGPRVPPPVVFKEAVEYIKNNKERALHILKSLAPKVGVSHSSIMEHATGD